MLSSAVYGTVVRSSGLWYRGEYRVLIWAGFWLGCSNNGVFKNSGLLGFYAVSLVNKYQIPRIETSLSSGWSSPRNIYLIYLTLNMKVSQHIQTTGNIPPATQRNFPEEINLDQHRCRNLQVVPFCGKYEIKLGLNYNQKPPQTIESATYVFNFLCSCRCYVLCEEILLLYGKLRVGHQSALIYQYQTEVKWDTNLMQHCAGFISAESLYMFRAQAPIIRSI